MHDTQILQHNNPADIQANNSTLKEWSGEHGKQQTDIGSDLTPVTAFINGDTIPCNDSNSQNALEAWEYGGCVSYETSSSSISTFSRLGQHRKSTNTISAEFGSASNRPPSLDEPECERSGLIGDCKFLTSMAIGGGDVQCRKSGDNVDTETLCLSGEGHVGDSGQKHRRLADMIDLFDGAIGCVSANDTQIATLTLQLAQVKPVQTESVGTSDVKATTRS